MSVCRDFRVLGDRQAVSVPASGISAGADGKGPIEGAGAVDDTRAAGRACRDSQASAERSSLA